jgi:hypothetical protein
MRAGEFHGGDVNAVLRLVKSLTDDGACQLSILTVALVTACRACGVEKSAAISVIREAFDDERKLVPLDSADAVGS